MQGVKRFVIRYFEPVVVLVLVAATAFAVLIAVDKLAFLNFFYIPVLTAAYFLGVRQGVFVAVAAVLMIAVYGVINPSVFAPPPAHSPGIALFLWGAFLVLTSYLVGSLYEAKSRAFAELKHAYDGILGLVATLIDAVDKHSEDHSVRVAALAARIAVVLDLPTEEIEDIHIAGLLHELSSVDMNLETLRKAAAFEAPGARGENDALGKTGGLLHDVVRVIDTYRESFDGNAEWGLKAQQIPRGARILAVADEYESRLTPRPYGSGLMSSEALAEVERLSGTRLDPDMVRALITTVETD